MKVVETSLTLMVVKVVETSLSSHLSYFVTSHCTVIEASYPTQSASPDVHQYAGISDIPAIHAFKLHFSLAIHSSQFDSVA
jgi:hypothetical protein